MIYPYILSVLAVFFWSANVVVGNALVNDLTPWQIAFFRWFIACICFLPFVWKSMCKSWRIIQHHKLWILATSFIGITLSNTFVYYASRTVQSTDLSLIGVTGPIFLIVFSKLAGDIDLNKKQIFGFLCTIIGLIIVILHGRLESIKTLHFAVGDLWMLTMAITFGFYSFLMTKRPSTISQNITLGWLLFLGCIGTVPFFITDTISHPLAWHTTLTPTIMWIMLYMGVCNSLISYLCWNKAIDSGHPVKIAMIYYLMPIFSAIEAHFLLAEKLYLSQLYGGFIILYGIYLVNKTAPAKQPISEKRP